MAAINTQKECRTGFICFTQRVAARHLEKAAYFCETEKYTCAFVCKELTRFRENASRITGIRV